MEPTPTSASSDAKKDGQRFYHAQPNRYQLIFNLSADEMECIGHLDISEGGSAPSIAEITAFLSADGITVGVVQQAVERLQSEARPGSSATCPIATGTPATPGENGRLDYSLCSLEPPATKDADNDDDKSSQVDFRSIQQFINVDPDQEIGRVIPPTNGIPGRTVRGKPVPSTPGKPLLIKLGKNVHFAEDDGTSLVAEIHGRVKLEGDSIHVVEEYVVDGDVDFGVGNIRFNGFVEVRGDVLDGFQINASKGLKITGNVGNCRLISPGNIEFCGMDGQGSGSILCGGTITAKFIHDSSIECTGSTVVEVELINCTVRCRSTILAGMISGGSCIATGGVDAKKLGSPAGIKTKIQAGADYHDLERLQELFTQLASVHEDLSKAKAMDEINRLSEDKKRLTSSIIEVRNRRPPGANPKVNIRSRLYEGVTVQVGSAVEAFNGQFEGPLSLIENSVEGGLRQVPLTELTVHADQVERSYLDEQQRRMSEEAAAAAQEHDAAEDAQSEDPSATSDQPATDQV